MAQPSPSGPDASGTPRTADPDPLLPALLRVRDIAREHDATVGAIALAWLLGHEAEPAVIVPAVPGPEWDAAAEALETELDEEEQERIGELLA